MADNAQAPINTVTAYLVALLGIGLAAFIVIGSLSNFGAVSDIPEFYAGAWMLFHKQAGQIYSLPNIFNVEQSLFPSTRGIALFVPPPGVLLLAPLVLLPAGLVAALWTFLLAAALALSLWLIIRCLNLSRNDSLWLVGIVFLSGPAVEALRLGQLAPLMLLAMTAAMTVASRRPRLAGLLLALLVVKPQQLFPLLLFSLASTRKQLIITAGIGLLVLFGLSLVIFGKEGMTLYVTTVSDPQNLQLMQPELNPTIRGQLMRFAGMHWPFTGVIAGIAWLASAAIIALIGWRNRGSGDWLALCLVACLPLGLLTSFHCHDYDLLLLVPGLAILTRTVLWKTMPTWAKACFMVGIAAFVLPFYNDIHYGYLLRGGSVNPHFLLLLVLALFMAYKALTAPQSFALIDSAPEENAVAA